MRLRPFLIAVTMTTAATTLASGASVGAVNTADGDVEHREFACDVSWEQFDSFILVDCDIQNVRRPNGGYSIILHGQVPEDRLAEFQESGVTRFDTGCWVNYLFIEGVRGGDDPADPDPAPIVSSGTRYFSAGGAMTEVCHLRP